jgi:hypothetical protein
VVNQSSDVGAFYVQNNINASGTVLRYLPGLAAGWRDYVVEYSFYAYDNDIVGLLTRFTNGGNFYSFLWNADDVARNRRV